MARKKRANRKVASTFRPPLVGDVFRDADPNPIPEPTPKDIDLDKMPLRRLIQLALEKGHDPRIVCGVDVCTDHEEWKPITDRFAQTSTKIGQYSYGIDIVWCRYCLQWLRDPFPQNMSLDTVIE